MMEQALIKVGLPVKCRKCGKKGFVKPGTDYGGWFGSRLFKLRHLRWYCPKHAKIGKAVDDRFFEHCRDPEPAPDAIADLYAILDN